MSSLTDAQAALAAANTVVTDVAALNAAASTLRNMLQNAQTSAAPVSPRIMDAMRTHLTNLASASIDATAAAAAVQVVVTDLGG
jgi:hypothetical protein